MLWLYQRTMFGELDNPENENLKDLNIREWVYLTPLVVLCFWIGLYPKPFFAILEPATAKLAATLENSRPAEFTWEGDALLRQAETVPALPEITDSEGSPTSESLSSGGRP